MFIFLMPKHCTCKPLQWFDIANNDILANMTDPDSIVRSKENSSFNDKLGLASEIESIAELSEEGMLKAVIGSLCPLRKESILLK